LKDPFWSFARRVLRYRWTVLGAMLCATLSAGGLGAGLVALGPVLDNILGTQRDLPVLARELNARLAAWGGWAEWLPRVPESVIERLPTGAYQAVLWIVVGLGVLTIVGAVCNFLHQYLSLTVVSRTIADIRRRAFRRVIHLPLRTVVSRGPTDLMSRVVNDTNQLSAGLNALLSKAVAQATKGVVALATAFVYNWRLALIALMVAPILATVIRKLGKRIRRASRSALQSQSGLYLSANEVLSGLRVVKVHGSERLEAGRFHRINREVVRQELRVRTARALSSPLIETISIVVLGGLSLIAVKAILDGHLSKTDFLMVLGSLAFAAASLKPLTGFVNDIQQSSAAAGRISELLDMPSEPGHDRRLPKLPRHAQSLAFEGVRLRYPGAEHPALDGVSLAVRCGETVAFVGPNGCGKTTLLSLVPRLFDPDEGVVLVDGRNVKDYSVRSLRKQIGVVTQETVLFRGSVRANIAYAAGAVSDEQVRAAARRARAEDFILDKPGGYDFEIGEQGAGLSGGQRQRLAIARAMLRDPAILILDEATSMIDADSESKIAEAIAEFIADGRAGAIAGTARGRGRTCLIVAHRLSTVVSADRIVVMDQGRIVDIGTHQELLARCELYRSLAQHQLVSNTEPATA
jgi:ATP-binding cassette, subfamily B, bacterial MsbA